MHRSSRLFLAGLALVIALVAISAVGAAYLYYPWSLPDPAEADQEGLFRWLVTRDLGTEPAEIRHKLARRLDEECGEGVDWRELDERLTPEYRRRLWNNIPWLLEPWFMDKVAEYHREPEAGRVAYVDRVLDAMSAWHGLDAIRPVGDDGSPSKTLLATLLGSIEGWKADAEPKRREQVDAFLAALQTRWLVRRLAARFQGLGQGGKAAPAPAE